jgi:hypothetical protein
LQEARDLSNTLSLTKIHELYADWRKEHYACEEKCKQIFNDFNIASYPRMKGYSLNTDSIIKQEQEGMCCMLHL